MVDFVELTATLLRRVAESAFDRVGLCNVTERRGGAVRVHVIDIVRVQAGVAHGVEHALIGALPVSDGAVMWYASALMPKPANSA